MRKILSVEIGDDGRVVFGSDYNPVKGLNLYQRAFVNFMFEHDFKAVKRWMNAVNLLGIAEICSSARPKIGLSMFENTVDDLALSCGELKRHFGGNLNFRPAGV